MSRKDEIHRYATEVHIAVLDASAGLSDDDVDGFNDALVAALADVPAGLREAVDIEVTTRMMRARGAI
jgi:hypothetical protein